LALITDYHAGETRSRAVGLHQMAIYCGVIVGGFGGYVADSPALGWRWAFDACGVFGMLYAIPLVMILRDVRPSQLSDTATASANEQRSAIPGEHAASIVTSFWNSLTQTLKELFANPSFILLVLYFTLPALAGWIVRDWMPAILKKQFNIGQGHAGVSATLYWQLAAIGGAVLSGWLADRWMRHSIRGRIFVSAIGMCFIVPSVLGMGFAGSLGAAITCLILFGIGWGFFDTNNMPILSQIVRPEFRATGYGVMNFVSISCGGLADWGFGVMQDRGIPLPVIFGVFAGAAALSGLLVLLIRPRKELVA
jgi:MFS family permease